MTITQNADSTQVAASQQFPTDSNSDFAVISFMIRQLLAELETMTPVQVKAVHAGSGSPPAAGTVDVQLLVSILDGNGNATQQGVVYGLPYFRVQGGPWAIVCDPAANDFGFIVCASRDISNVQANPGKVLPGSFRKYSFSDGIFISAPFSGAPPANSVWLKSDGSFTISGASGVVIGIDASGHVNITATTMIINGDLHVSGAVIAGFGGGDQVGLQTHRHISGGAGNSTTVPIAGT